MKAWKRFTHVVRQNPNSISDVQRATANRARARWHFAHRFKSVDATDISARSLSGYSAIFSVFLAYTAAELVGEIAGTNVSKWRLEHPELAARLRKQLPKLNEDISEYLSDKRLANAFRDFMSGSSNDLRIAACVLRVGVAHGSLTANGANSLSAVASRTLRALADALLEEANVRFETWVLDLT